METINPVSKVSVALSPIEIKIVEKLEKKLGTNFSAALRIIVREWNEKKISEAKAHIVGQQEPVIITGELAGVVVGSAQEVKA